MATLWKTRAVLGLFLFLYASTVYGIDDCSALLGRKPQLTQLMPSFVNQRDQGLRFLGQTAGLCATACAVNMFQTALVESGRPPSESPVDLANQINLENPETLTPDGVRPASLDRLLAELTQKHFEATSIQYGHKILSLPEPYREQSSTLRLTDELGPQHLKEEEGSIKAITFAIFNKQTRSFIGWHIVQLLEGVRGSSPVIWISDPNLPATPVKFILEKVRTDEDDANTMDIVPTDPKYLSIYSGGQDVFLRVHSIVTLTRRPAK